MSLPLSPGYTVTLGNQQWTTQAIRLELVLNPAPLIDSLEVVFPTAAAPGAELDGPATLSLASGEADADVFSGTIAGLDRRFDTVRIRALDAGGLLARFRPAVTYEQVSAGRVIRNLCGEVGVSTGSVEEGPSFPFYVADDRRTALEHVARLSAFGGAMARVSADNQLETVVVTATQADRALRYGREITTLSRRQEAAPLESFAVAGESGAGSHSVPEALRPTTDFFAGSRPAGPDAGHVWRWQPALRTAQAAQRAGAAMTLAYKTSRAGGTLEAFLQPDLRPGSVIEIQDLPGPPARARLRIDSVRHRLSGAGAFTRLWFSDAGEGLDVGSLLGSLGGLL